METQSKQAILIKSKKSLGWSALTEILAKIILPITNIVLARLLNKEAFGIVASLTVVISLAEIFSDAGFSKYLIQSEFESEETFEIGKNNAFWSNFVISIVSILVIFAFRNDIARLIGSEGYGLPLFIAALQIPLHSMSSINLSLLRRDFKYNKIMFVRLITVMSSLAFSVLFAVLGFDYWTIILASLISAFSQLVFGVVFTRWIPKINFSFSHFKKMFSFSFFSFSESILAWMASSLLIIIMSHNYIKDDVGLYKVGVSTQSGILTLFSAVFINVLVSTLSRFQDDEIRFKENFLSFLSLASFLIVPASIGLFVFREPITFLLLGDKWQDASFIFGITALSGGATILLRSFQTSFFLSKGKPVFSVITQIIFLLFYIPTAIISAKYELTVFVIAITVAILPLYVSTLLFMERKFEVRFVEQVKSVFLFYLPAALIMAILSYFLLKTTANVYIQLIYIVPAALFYFSLNFLFFRKNTKKLLHFFIQKDTTITNQEI